jgi:hypothetical protein
MESRGEKDRPSLEEMLGLDILRSIVDCLRRALGILRS